MSSSLFGRLSRVCRLAATRKGRASGPLRRLKVSRSIARTCRRCSRIRAKPPPTSPTATTSPTAMTQNRGTCAIRRRSLTRSPDPPVQERRQDRDAEALRHLQVDHPLERGGRLAPSSSAPLEELRDGRDKVGHVDGLALVRVEPGGHDLLPVLTHHGRGHGHDGNPPRGLLGSEPSEGLDSVNPRQPNVHQDQAWAPLSGKLDALFARLGLDDLIPFERQHVPDELPVLVVVLDDQDERAGHGLTGSVKVKVEPRPTSLCTQILPPWSSMNFRERASPRPVPSAFLSAVPTCRNSSNTAS